MALASEPGTPFALTLQAMKDRGVKLIYGRWLIEGAPRVLLFDTGSCYNRFVACPARTSCSLSADWVGTC